MSFTESLEKIVAENPNGLLGCPPNWSRARMSEFAMLLNGFAFPSSQFDKNSGVPLVRIRDLGRSTTESRFSGAFDSRYLVRAGDLLVGMDGDFKCAIWQGEPALLNQRVCRIEPDETRYSRRFLYYCLPGYLDAIHGRTSSLTVKHLSSKTLLDLPLPVPPRAEQEAIVAALDSYFSRLDEVEAGLERVRRNLKRYRASVLQAAVTGRLVPTEAELARAEGRVYEPAPELLKRILVERRKKWEESGRRGGYVEPPPPDTSNLPELPEGWCWATAAQLGEVVTGTTPPTSNPDFYGGSLPFFKPTDLDSGYHVRTAREFLTEAGVARSRMLPAGAVLVTCIGATVGKTGLARVDSATNQQINALVPAVTGVDSRYLFWWFVSPEGNRSIIESASSTTLPIVNKSRFERLAVPLPPESEQSRILATIESLESGQDGAVAAISRSLQRLGRLRQALLKRAFEGKLAVQDPKGEAAEALLERIWAEKTPAGAGKAIPARRRKGPR